MASFEPILPKKPVIDASRTQRRLSAELGSFLIDANRMCADYEAPPSESYSRTNTLKKSWRKSGPQMQGRDLVGAITSGGPSYNIFVRGPAGKQAKHMANRGWLSVTKIADKLWPPTKRRLQAILRGG